MKTGLVPMLQNIFVANDAATEKIGQGILKGEYHCTIDLLFDRFGLVCFANKNKKFQLSYS